MRFMVDQMAWPRVGRQPEPSQIAPLHARGRDKSPGIGNGCAARAMQLVVGVLLPHRPSPECPKAVACQQGYRRVSGVAAWATSSAWLLLRGPGDVTLHDCAEEKTTVATDARRLADCGDVEAGVREVPMEDGLEAPVCHSEGRCRQDRGGQLGEGPRGRLVRREHALCGAGRLRRGRGRGR